MDENVGRVVDALDRLGIAEETVVVFTSDNGGLCTLGSRRGPTSNRPLRSGKGWCYEGGLRVPLIVRAPGVSRPGMVSSVPVVSMDLYPTLLDLLGLPLRPDRHRDGVSLLPLLRGAASLDREALYWHFPHYHGSTWTPGAAVRAGDWKLVEFYEYGTAELYNLAEDLGESRELSAEHPEQREHLLELLHSWQRELGAKLPRPNPLWAPGASIPGAGGDGALPGPAGE
jgi:arylsulfatase A-like enzyme